MVAAMNLIAVDDRAQDYELNQKACGRIVWWALSGPMHVATFGERLALEGASVQPPEAPSPKVALHRAAEDAARAAGTVCRSLGAGAWALASKPREENADDGRPRLVSDIVTRAMLRDDDSIRAEGPDAEAIEDAFARAREHLSSQDMSGWLCDAIAKLGAVALRESGGFYFVPKDAVERWQAVARAVEGCSGHKLYNVPALRSADALDAILAAVTSDTQKACADITRDMGSLGPRGLGTRENELRALSDRASRYEAILGTKLDVLRDAIRETQAGITAAVFALSSESSAE